jgi:hypothetical protein
MAETQPTLVSLAAKITELSETLSSYLRENNIPAPTFAADSPTSYANLSPEIFMTRQVLLDTLMDLWYLTQGPSESIFNYVHTVSISYPVLGRDIDFLTLAVHARRCRPEHSELF